jgi:hypothetical protein
MFGSFPVGFATVFADHPRDWGGGGKDFELSLDASVKHGGKASGSIKPTVAEPEGFGTFTQGFRADQYRGKRLRFSGFVKAEDVQGVGAGLWMRIDGKTKTGLAFDNMWTRPIKGSSDWQKYAVVLDVPEDAQDVYFGVLLAGKGRIWVDDLAFDVVGKDVESTGLVTQATDREGPAEDLPNEPKNLDFER